MKQVNTPDLIYYINVLRAGAIKNHIIAFSP